ncbi:mitochondrial import inner membrane translocase subunit Tim21-like [Branchiostoma floridae x Branchiostoma japonicum]
MLSRLHTHKPITMEFVALAVGVKNMKRFTNREMSTKQVQYPVQMDVQGLSRRFLRVAGPPCWQSCRLQMRKAEDRGRGRREVVESRDGGTGGQLTTGQKVVEAGKDVTYLGIVIFGVGVMGVLFYAIGRELFSGGSINGIYTDAMNRCKDNEEVKVALGTPIAGFGEETRRGRRRHPAYTEYVDDAGKKHLRMKFYLKGGSGRRATVHLEVTENDRGKYDSFRYLFVQLDAYPHRTMIIEDNR